MPGAAFSRLIVDTNVLLDASFDLQGVARRALVSAAGQGLQLIVDKAVELEAARILARRVLALGLRFDPWPFVEQLLCTVACTRVQAVPPTICAADY